MTKVQVEFGPRCSFRHYTYCNVKQNRRGNNLFFKCHILNHLSRTSSILFEILTFMFQFHLFSDAGRWYIRSVHIQRDGKGTQTKTSMKVAWGMRTKSVSRGEGEQCVGSKRINELLHSHTQKKKGKLKNQGTNQVEKWNTEKNARIAKVSIKKKKKEKKKMDITSTYIKTNKYIDRWIEWTWIETWKKDKQSEA